MLKHEPKTLQNSVRHVPGVSKIESRQVTGSQDPAQKRPRPAKRCPRASKSRPRSAQETPRASHQRPQAGQVTPERSPRQTQSSPKPGSPRPKRVFSVILVGRSVRQAPRTIFFHFLVCATIMRYGNVYFASVNTIQRQRDMVPILVNVSSFVCSP